MIDTLKLALAGSGLVLAVIVIWWRLRSRRPAQALAWAVVLAIGLRWIYTTTFPPGETRDIGDGETAVLVMSYFSMVLGMVAHYIYQKGASGEKTLTIEWMPLLMPILVSPIVFIPLMTIASQVASTTTGSLFAHAKLMVFLVAFENGFFWKHFFDQHRPALPTPAAVPQRT